MSVESLYDDAGRKQYEKMWPSPEATSPSKTITYSYNDRGDLTGWDDGEMSGTFDIDPLGREAASSVDYGPFTKGSSTTYFRNGLQKTFTGPDEVTYGYAYDPGGRLRGIAIPGEGSIVYNEYLWSQPTHVTLPGGTVQEYQYDDFLRMTRAYSRDPAGNTIMDQHYQRDINGRVTRKETEEGYYQYGYDDSYQLISVESDIMPNESYEYDRAGNRYPTDPELKAQWVYNEDNELLATDTATYEYDAAGNRARQVADQTTTSFYYDEASQLRAVGLDEEPANVVYRYDPFRRRVAKSVGPTGLFFSYTSRGLVAELHTTGDLARAVAQRPGAAWGVASVAISAGEYVYAHADERRSPTLWTTRSGRVAWAATYSSYGQRSTFVEQMASAINVGGLYADAETGLQYAWHRYYDADLGRFMSPDLLGRGERDGAPAGLPRILVDLSNGGVLADDEPIAAPPKRWGPFLSAVGRTQPGHGASAQLAVAAAHGNSFAYAMADPINRIDPTGLAIFVCVRGTHFKPWGGQGPGNHEYFWNDATNTCCGRGSTQMCHERGPFGDEPDLCLKVPDSDGMEGSVMGCCEQLGDGGAWVPYANDCFVTVDYCLRRAGLQNPRPWERFPTLPR